MEHTPQTSPSHGSGSNNTAMTILPNHKQKQFPNWQSNPAAHLAAKQLSFSPTVAASP
jgi:hypothetical protein